jgi:capsular exopolysaccharide synthesis family protein
MPKQTSPPGLETATRSADPQELSIGDILRIFSHRIGIILALTLVCLLLATAYFLLAQNKYTATATIEINKDNSMSLGLDDLSGIGSKLGTGTDLLTDMMTHEADIENDSTAIDTINRLHLLSTAPFSVDPGKNPKLDAERGLPIEKAPFTRERALKIFMHRLRVELVKDTRLLNVSYTDTDPVRAATVANTVVEVYLSNHTEARYAASLKTSNWLTGQLAELKDKVADSERKVSEFQTKAGLVGVYVSNPAGGKEAGQGSIPQVTSTDDERLIALNTELTRAEVERIGREALYRFAQAGDPEVLASLSSSSLVGGESEGARGSSTLQGISQLQGLRAQETALKLQHASDMTKYGPNNPEMLDVNNQLTALGEQIHATLTTILEGAKSDYDIAVLSENSIRQQVRDQEEVVGKLDQSVAGLLVLEQESASSRLLYQDMYTRLEEANLSAGIGNGVITIANPARPTVNPSAPNPLKVFPVGLAMGLLLGAVAALLLDHTQNILYGMEDFLELLPFAQLGVIPDFNSNHKTRRYGGKPASNVADLGKQDPGKVAWLHRDPTSPISEAFRQLRTSILMSKSSHPPKTMLFTSALSGDGKTVTSFNLATAFAYQGARVLLVDADMRRPTMHLLAGCSGSIGLSNVLTGSASTAEAIVAHADIERLSILPAGTIPPMAAELLGSHRFTELLTELKAAYDYVLIDTPPLLLVTDPLLIAPMVEGIVLVTRSGRDTKPALKSAISMLNRPQIHVLGYVVNGVSMTFTYYRYDGPQE